MKLTFFCIINRCIYVEYELYEEATDFFILPSLSLLNCALPHSSSLPFIDSVKCARARISPLSSMPLPFSLSHDVNYRFWMSSSSNYSGADLLLFLLFLFIFRSIYLARFICMYVSPVSARACVCVCASCHGKHGSIHVGSERRKTKVVLCAKLCL